MRWKPHVRFGSGPGKRAGRNAGTAPRSDSTKRLLRLSGASVVDVGFSGEGVVVTVRLRRRRPVCSGCGQTGRRLEIQDRRVKRWRHLDVGANRCFIECQLRRLYCRDCGVRLEPVPWARAGSRVHARLRGPHGVAGAADGQTQVTRLLRVGWRTVGEDPHAGRRRQARRAPPGRARAASASTRSAYGADHRFLTCVADHETGRDRVGHRGPQRRHPAGVLRRAHRRAEGLDPGGLDRHVRRL